MKRTTTLLVTLITTSMTLAACGGSNAYCEAVKKDTTTLNTFGTERSDAGYTTYAGVLRKVAKAAPTDTKKDWTKLADVTEGVIAAQKDVGVPLEDMTDEDKRKDLSTAELKTLNDAYQAFNATRPQRDAVVKNVLQECDITLK